jgi:predicted dehydrogenase
MLRIGLIGTESTHAATFAKLLQTAKSNAFPAAVLDEGDGEGQKLAERFGIAQVCATPEELLRHVDAVMICYRLADRHFEPAAKALAAGRHVWLDKPFTAEAAEARALLRLADQNGLVLTGGSTCRFCAGVRAFAKPSAPYGGKAGRWREILTIWTPDSPTAASFSTARTP